MANGKLYVVATPIGNLADLTHRAEAVLGQVDLIACEDTRRSLKLLNRYGIKRPLESYHEFNEAEKAAALARRIKNGLHVALISDAGTPTVSDPGYRIVRLCRQNGSPVISLPGPSSMLTALSVSGLPSDEFFFVGFLPPKTGSRRTKLASLQAVNASLIFFETARRIQGALDDMLDILGNREVFIGRELTKLHEEHLFGHIAEVRAKIINKGEFVIVIEGSRNQEIVQPEISNLSRAELLKQLSQKSGIGRKELYEALYRKKK